MVATGSRSGLAALAPPPPGSSDRRGGRKTEHEYAIKVRGLRKDYGRVEALRGVDLDVRRGTLLALLGPNGSGKTTVVKTLSTLTRPSRGSVVVNGYDVARRRNGVRSSIGMVSQFVALDRLHSGRENLVLLGRLQKLSKTNATRRAAQLLERFELTEAADRPVKTYSGGMKRRLDLAVSLIVTPPALLLDEPTTGLDPRSRAVLWAAIRRLDQPETLPDGLRGFVEHQPVTLVVDTVRALLLGLPAGNTGWYAVVWWVVILGVAAPVATRLYHRRYA